MDVSAGIKASLAGRYASALFDLASEAGTVTAVESDLDKLGEALGESGELRAREGRTVKLKTRVEPDLLGGLVVTVGSKRIDSSIRTRLNSLAQAMKG